MRPGSRLFRLTRWLASTSLALGTAGPAFVQPAFAQPAPYDNGPGSQPASPQNGTQPSGDPPTLAGRLSEVAGTVSQHAEGQDQWNPAPLNTPVTGGDSFWTEPRSRASIEVGADHFVMSETTELDVTQLDQSQFVATAAQGELYLGLHDVPGDPGQGNGGVTLNTPRGSVQITQPGQYDIIAGDTSTPTSVTVVAGQARVTGTGVDLTVQAGQTATLSGSDTISGGVGGIQYDAFLRDQLARDTQAPPAQARNMPPQVQRMTGGTDLARYGTWQPTPDYGQVWYPSDVAADWAPYRAGHWAFVAPWGWTWVDEAPWGFAPFHYGRWVQYDGRWGWVAAAPDAAIDAYPVYAPALVGFVDVGGAVLAGAALGFGAGLFAGGGIGWVPLGFREPFYPWYHTSPGYLRNINRVSVVNVTNISINNYRNVKIDNFRNARFATVAPRNAFVDGQRLNGVARPLPAAALARAQPVVGRLPATPTARTPGLTREAASRYHVPMPARAVTAAAPGPRLSPGGMVARPALGPHPGAGIRPEQRSATGHAPGIRPGLPPLRPAGEAHSRPDIAPPDRAGAGRPGEARPAPETRSRSEARPALPGPPAPRPEPSRRPDVAPKPTQVHRPEADARAHRPEAEARPHRPEAEPRTHRPEAEPRHAAPVERPHAPAPRPAPHPAPHPEPHPQSHPPEHRHR